MSEDLKSIAERVKKDRILSSEENDPVVEDEMSEFEREEDVTVIDGDDLDDDDPVVISGGESDEITEEDLYSDGTEFEITEEDLKATMPDLDETTFAAASSKIKNDIDVYRKNLIIRSGLTVEEANEAAMNRMKKLGEEENSSYLEENPKLGIVEVNKKDASKLEFTPDEREKLTKVRSIKLKLVEDVDLKNIEIERVDKNRKSAMLQSLDTNLSQYSVPLPLMSDYCQFRGSQIIQLIQAVRYNDSTLDEVISKKASLVYNQLANGANLRKFDDEGNKIMSYREFTNKFLFHDLDMALYGILVASSMESIESTLTCGDCGHQFQWKYNLKKLLNLDDLTDDFKEKYETILEHKSDDAFLQKLYEKNHKSKRVKSPITNNIYDLNYPTVARAISLYRVIDTEDETMLYLSAFALFIDKMYVYNKKTEKYIPIEEDEYKDLLETLQMIPQEEIDIIQDYLKPYLYAPKFILKSKCESCGFKMENELSIDELVFLKARDSSTEIQS